MRCSRCQGCMIEDYLLDMEDSSGPMWLQAWRCMNCGNVFDSVLEHNRLTHGAKTPVAGVIFSPSTAEIISRLPEATARLAA